MTGLGAETGGLRLRVERHDDVVVVAVDGPLDVYTSRSARTELDALVTPGDRVVVDLGGVTMLDSSGLSALLRLRNRAEEVPGGRFGLVCPRRRVRRVLDIAGLGDAFVVGRDADELAREWLT